MQIIEIEFTARQFHATPWDAHVNEGRIEWPPCPWRLLRSLVATGYAKLGWPDAIPDDAVSLLKKLSSCRPRFGLPVSVETHTRHFMPVIEGKNERKAKVFDTFLRFRSGENRMQVVYDCQLEHQERVILSALVEGLSYLGRAESWVDACLIDERDAMHETELQWSQPANASTVSDRIRLLAPMESDSYVEWREEAVSVAVQSALALAESNAKNKKLTSAAKKKATDAAMAPFPHDLVAALQVDTNLWQKQGWQRPPGSTWVDYEVSKELYIRQPLQLKSRHAQFDKPTAILLAIDGEGNRGTLRPTVKRALPLTELLHAKAVWCASNTLNLNLEHVPELTGMQGDKTPLKGTHDHAHWIPLSLFDPLHVDHVLVYAKSGFGSDSLQAICQLRTAYSKGISKLAINMVGQGSIAEIYEQLARVDRVDKRSLAILRPSATFESATPLVFRKFLASHGKKNAENQIREELVERGLPEPSSVVFWSTEEMVKRKLKGYVLRRQPSKRQPPFERSWGVTIQFAELIQAVPIALGYASHYGLGVFRAQ